MATKTLNAGATDLSDPNSWSGAALPASGDDLVIPDGGQNIIDGLGSATWSSRPASSITIGRAFTGSIKGANGEAWDIDVNVSGGTKKITHAGPGEVRFDSSCDDVECAGDGKISLAGGTIAGSVMAGSNGFVSVGESVTLTNADAKTVGAGAPGIVIADDSGAIDNIFAQAGRVTCDRNVTTLVEAGPRTVVKTTGDATVGTSKVYGEGMHHHASSGTLTTLDVKSRGAFDIEGAESAPEITNSTIAEGAKVRTRVGGIQADINGRGGSGSTVVDGDFDTLGI